MKKLLWILLIPNLCFGAPAVTSVTGVLLDATTITISGSGFGTKATAAPLKWDDFESGTLGAVVGNGWALTRGYNAGATGFTPSWPTYSNTVLRTGSSRSVKHPFEDQGFTCPDPEGCEWSNSYGLTGDSGFPANVNLDSGTFTSGLTFPVLYIDFWYYINNDPVEPRNIKIFRIHTGENGTPNSYLNIYCSGNSDEMRFGGDGGDADVYNHCDFGCGPLPTRDLATFWTNQWRHIQAYLVESSAGVQDGKAQIYTDYVNDPSDNTFMTRTGSTHWNTVWIGNYIGKGSEAWCPNSYTKNHYVYTDDAYIDTTPARIEIGDNISYSACTHREIQIPTAWSSSSISATIHKGSFASVSGQYLFVVDGTNTPSTGFQLTPTSSCNPF